MKEKKWDILIMGQFLEYDVFLAEVMSTQGLKVAVVRQGLALEGTPDRASGSFDVIVINSTLRLLKLLWKSRLGISICGALPQLLDRLWPIRHLLRLPPIIAWSTGSDVSELPNENSKRAKRLRESLALSSGHINSITQPGKILSSIEHHIWPPLPFLQPYFLSVLPSPDPNVGRRTGPIRFFHCSNLDWAVTDSIPGRRSFKSNDLFFRAFARAIHSGKIDARCLVLERGADKDVARELVRELGVEEFVEWLPPVSRDEFWRRMQEADVVVDQFNLPSLGGIGREALHFGKPLLTNLDDRFLNMVLYSEMPPVLSCATEDRIYERILSCADREFLRMAGEAGHEWYKRHFSLERVMPRFLVYYSVLTGDNKTPYKAEF